MDCLTDGIDGGMKEQAVQVDRVVQRLAAPPIGRLGDDARRIVLA